MKIVFAQSRAPEAEVVAFVVKKDDVAALALFLASDDARMCTGHEYFVDAGWR